MLNFPFSDPIILPSSLTIPLSGGVNQLIALKRVLLPQPLGPIIHITSPLEIFKDTFFKALIGPNFLLSSLISKKFDFI